MLSLSYERNFLTTLYGVSAPRSTHTYVKDCPGNVHAEKLPINHAVLPKNTPYYNYQHFVTNIIQNI